MNILLSTYPSYSELFAGEELNKSSSTIIISEEDISNGVANEEIDDEFRVSFYLL